LPASLANDLRGKDQWILATKKPIVQAFKADAFFGLRRI
jgi:hypothetical protein